MEYEKDELYYYDLIYELKDICNLIKPDEREKDTEERIRQRKNDIHVVDTKGSGIMKQDFRASEFNRDVIRYIRRISDIANQKYFVQRKTITVITSLRVSRFFTNISGYGRAIEIVLQELEEMKCRVASNDDVPKIKI